MLARPIPATLRRGPKNAADGSIVPRKARLREAATASARLGAALAVAAGCSTGSAAAQSGPGAGTFPGSILVPGTQTSLKIGGYVKLDYTYDFSAAQNIVGGLFPNAIPLDANVPGTTASAGHGTHGVSQMTASESRFNIETRTPTSYGEFKTFLEGDFVNPNGLTNNSNFTTESDSSGFRLRYAYGALGPWLAGQFNSVFRDALAEAETLDFNGPVGAGVYRQPQIRYTYPLGPLHIVGGVENPTTLWTDATATTPLGGQTFTTFGTGQGNKVPDFTAAAAYDTSWGHLEFRGVFRDLYDHNGSTVTQSEFGWGLGVSGRIKTWGKDDVIFQINGGDGIGRYVSNFVALVPDAVVNSAAGRMETVSAWGALLGYQHWWTDSLRTTAVASYIKQENPSDIFTPAALAVQGDRWWTTHVNLIWSPVSFVDTGIEFMHDVRRIQNGQTGNANRLQVSTKFKF